MSRFSICLVLVVAAAYAMAEECSNCTCGQECNPSGVCEDGCLVYDMFLSVGEKKEVYGKECECFSNTDEIGSVVECEEGEFVDAPAMDIWTTNPNCS